MLTTSDVFGLNTEISEYSYVDRGELDGEIQKYSARNQHIALRGESKSGKSWLRQKNFPDAVVVQCRIEFSAFDVLKAVLSSLGVSVKISKEKTVGASLEFQGEGELGWKLLAKAKASGSVAGTFETSETHEPVGRDAGDLEFICKIIEESGRRIVVEDFHYLTADAQRQMAHDLKAMWDYSVYIVIIGVWVRQNYLTYLNPDLAGRIREISVYWTPDDLSEILDKGSKALNLRFSQGISKRLVLDSFGNAGLLQSLSLSTLDEANITCRENEQQVCDSEDHYETAALAYAEQLEAVFLEFARRVSRGIRKRRQATGIYAHVMWAVFDSDDAELIRGVHVDTIYERAHARQSRIQKSNRLRNLMSGNCREGFIHRAVPI